MAIKGEEDDAEAGAYYFGRMTEQISDESYAAMPDMGAILGGIWTLGNRTDD